MINFGRGERLLTSQLCLITQNIAKFFVSLILRFAKLLSNVSNLDLYAEAHPIFKVISLAAAIYSELLLRAAACVSLSNAH